MIAVAEPQRFVPVRQAGEVPAGEPWGKRLWLTLAAILIVGGCLDSYGIATWPMADDEVPTLVEIGRFTVQPNAFSVPAGQLERLPRSLPVYYAFQRAALSVMPNNELGFRLPSLICALLTSAIAFLAAARWRGLWFGVALAIVVNFSQPFVYLAQIDRFYSMPLLLLAVALIAIHARRGGAGMLAATAVLTVLTVLSHNVTVAVFVLACMAACAAYVVGRAPLQLVVRTGVAAAISVALYFLWIRPLVSGWHSTGNPTPVMVSLAAHVGIPALALAALGVWLTLTEMRTQPKSTPSMLWWALMFAGSVCFLQFTNMTWNPRYFLFFMPAIWMLAAHAMEFIAKRVGYRSAAAAWYCCVIVLMLPNLLSHYQDGSRHDYRRAAGVLRVHAQDGQAILSDDAETISYYLPDSMTSRLFVRTKAKQLPADEFFLVTRANAWTPLPRLPGRDMQLLDEIYHRRFDQFSHVLRVYRVAAGPAR